MNTAAMNIFLYKSLYRHIFSFPLGRFLEAEALGHAIDIYITW